MRIRWGEFCKELSTLPGTWEARKTGSKEGQVGQAFQWKISKTWTIDTDNKGE